MTRLSWFSSLLMLTLAIAACGPAATPVPTPDAKATETQIAASIYATQTASAPTATGTPTITPTKPSTDTPPPTAVLSAAPTKAANVEVVVTSTLDSGWTQYEMRTSEFSIALPTGWERVDMNPDALTAGLSVVGESNPTLKTMFSSDYMRRLVTSGVRFYGLDLSPESLATLPPTSVNVLKVDIGVGFSLDTVVQLSLAQLKNLADPSVPLTHHRVTLGNVEAEVLDYQSKLTLPTGNTAQLHFVQYLMIDGTSEYVVTLTGDNARTKDAGSVWTKIGESFRLLK